MSSIWEYLYFLPRVKPCYSSANNSSLKSIWSMDGGNVRDNTWHAWRTRPPYKQLDKSY